MVMRFQILKYKDYGDDFRNCGLEYWLVQKQVEWGDVEGDWKVFQEGFLKSAENVCDVE